MPILQPIDWHEHDNKGAYVVDVYGRMEDKTVACVRINGFKPYFYSASASGNSTRVSKYDAMAGFNELKKKDVYKVECESKMKFHMEVKKAKANRHDLYESNLHPFLRLFHEQHLGPASPLEFKGIRMKIPLDENDEAAYKVDSMWTCNYKDVSTCEANIPLLVACYDLEMYSESGLFPQAKKDPICQMGISYRWSDNMMEPYAKKVYVLGTVEKSDDFVACETEEQMILRFHDDLHEMNPDIICGYNTFGFDDGYLEDRCMALGISDDIHFPRCPKDLDSRKFSEVKKMELASGKYDLRMITMTGRLGIDLLLNMRREHSLESFKLDHVATHFLKGKVTKQENNQVFTYSTRGLNNGNYVTFNFVETTSEPCYEEDEKFQVYDVTPNSFKVRCDEILFADFTPEELSKLHWSFAKDDVSPQELFDLHANGGPEGRGRIAKYCIQDCDLVLTLMYKLDTLVNTRGMADVCKVPMNYVLTRGQGIKIFSAIVYFASQRDQIIRTQEAEGGDGIAYEGAIVLEPKIGMYLDQPVSVLDFNSLYPSNMIAYNLSPDTLVYERELDKDGFLRTPSKEQNTKIKSWIAGLEEKGFVFEEISYDNKDTGGKTVCTFVQKGENPMTTGVIPLTLDILLKKRKEFKQKMEDETYDESQRSVFNGLQLAYKVVANSVYGQAGSRTSPIRKTCVAACTTAAGRTALYTAKRIVESEFGAEVIYGDTDSIFIKFPTKDLAESIKLGIEAGKSITRQIGRDPYKIAYEKTLYPFILFCRKRYVGMKYEEDPNPAKAKQMSMGVVLKRRDNAPIVKDVFGGALKILMSGGGVKKAQSFVNEILLKIFDNKLPLEKFIVSKSLRDDYVTKVPEDIRKHKTDRKNPELNGDTAPYNIVVDYAKKFGLSMPDSSLAHRKLADRMAARDPGTAPKVGDRLQYVYVAENKHKTSQGDRIEHVDYVKAHKLTPDTQFYITNQIQNPVAQLFALCIEELDGYVAPRKPTFETLKEQYLEKYKSEEDATLSVLKKKEAHLDGMMFLGSPVLNKKVKAAVRGPMDAFIRK